MAQNFGENRCAVLLQAVALQAALQAREDPAVLTQKVRVLGGTRAEVRVLGGTRADVRVPAIHTSFATEHDFKIFPNKCTSALTVCSARLAQ